MIFDMVNVNVALNRRLAISCVLISTGAALLVGWSWMLKSALQLAIALKENTQMYTLWQVNPMPLYLEVYAYNWTNPQDIHTPGVKPKFEEIGPFSFLEVKEKGNVTWNTHNDTVSFRQYHTYYFDREKSVADLDLNMTTLNPVLTSASYQALQKNWGYFMRKGMQISFNQFGQEIAITKPVGAFLFEGYKDTLVTMSQHLPFIKGVPPLDKFGWFYTRNGSSFEGDFNMGTAFKNFGVLESWNFSNRTEHYPGKCGNLRGTSAGELYKPYIEKDKISFFSPDLCRTVPLDFEAEENVDGVMGYKFTAGASFLDNGTLHPENACYCPGECFPSGILNISSCKYGAPGFVSLPHFYNADEFYVNSVEGLQSRKDRHEFYITLEPLTGIPLKVAARLQLNLLLQPVKYLGIFEDIPKVFFPVLWFEEVVQIPDNLLILLKIVLYIPITLQIIGALLVFSGLVVISKHFYRHVANALPVEADAAARKQPLIKELIPLNHEAAYEFDVQYSGSSNEDLS